MKRVAPLFIALLLNACGTQVPSDTTSSTTTVVGSAEMGARIIFHKDNFTDLSDFVTTRQTNFKCLGDITTTYYVNGQDYTGTPTAFPQDTTVTDDFLPTTRPGFVKNVSLDMTNTYFVLTQSGALPTDACSYRSITSSAVPTWCADFDEQILVTPSPTIAPTPTPTATPTPTPTSSITPTPTATPVPSSTPFFDTKYYRVRDDWCTGQGPIIDSNPTTTQTHIGGLNIDIDRTQLATSEDLLMLMTYESYNQNAAWPTTETAQDETILEVDMIGTGLTLANLMGEQQPRPWIDYGNTGQPIYMKQIATLRDPIGSLRTEQVLIPLSQNALIDRIRIDRIRGSYHLFQIDLYRLGNRIGSE